ncbi:MAG: hypothetical protein OZ948_03835 [Deltaproteobacteria bacterium]|nr:hypothetical protein [Deltaproteobacteria bacterium]
MGRPRGLVLALVLAACASGSPRQEALDARFPSLGAEEARLLAQGHPFVLPAAGRATLFFCRWPSDAPIPVSLPPEASPEERRAIEAALRAWEGAGLGVRFLPLADGAPAPIEIRFADEAIETGAGRDTGNAVVDCRIAPLSQQRAGAGVVAGAQLASARLRLARRTGGGMSKPRALTPAEQTGLALHELGHALGFEGHVRRGESVMTSEVEKVPRAGRALLAGGDVSDPALRALYRLPSGAVLSSQAVEPWRTDLVDRLGRLAEQHGLDGPYLRVGEAAGRIFWRDPKGGEYGLVVVRLRELLRDPRRLTVLPEPRARSALPRANDLRPAPSRTAE